MNKITFFILFAGMAAGVFSQTVKVDQMAAQTRIVQPADQSNFDLSAKSWGDQIKPYKMDAAQWAVGIPVLASVATYQATGNMGKSLSVGGFLGVVEFAVFIAVHDHDVLTSRK